MATDRVAAIVAEMTDVMNRRQVPAVSLLDADVWRWRDQLAALSAAPAPATAAETLSEESLGLSIDMTDVDRLRMWAEKISTYGADLTHWASVPFLVAGMVNLATNIQKAVSDIGKLRLQPAAVAPTLSDEDYDWLEAMCSQYALESTPARRLQAKFRRMRAGPVPATAAETAPAPFESPLPASPQEPGR